MLWRPCRRASPACRTVATSPTGSGLLSSKVSGSGTALPRRGAGCTIGDIAPVQPIENVLAAGAQIAGLPFGGELLLDPILVLGAGPVGSRCKVEVPFIKPILVLQALKEHRLLKLLRLLVRDILRLLQRTHHLQGLLPLLRLLPREPRIGLLADLLRGLGEARKLVLESLKLALRPLRSFPPALRLGLSPLSRRRVYIAFFFLPLPIIGGIPFFAIIAGGIGFIGFFFDFAKIKLLVPGWGIR